MSLPVDCFNLIFANFDKHKEMLNFLSINKEWHQYKKNVMFHKQFVPYKASMKTLPYLENIKCTAIVYSKSALKTLPNNVTWIRYHSDDLLDIGDIPSQTQFIEFGSKFNTKIKPGVIPEGVTHIVFGYIYDQPLEKGVIPSTAKNVKFVFRFNQKLKLGDIPFGVTHLFTGHCYNQTFEKDVLPNSIIHLDVGFFFRGNRNKGYIPTSITSGTILNCL
jgi:hypothetical protein